MKKILIILGLGLIVSGNVKAQTQMMTKGPYTPPDIIGSSSPDFINGGWVITRNPDGATCEDLITHYSANGVPLTIEEDSAPYPCPKPQPVTPTITPVTVQILFQATSSIATSTAGEIEGTASSTNSTSTLSTPTDNQALIASLEAELSSLMSQLVVLLEAKINSYK